MCMCVIMYAAGVVGLVMDSDSPLAVLRLLRMFRLGRTMKALRENKDVQALLEATIGSGIPMLNNVMFLSTIIIMFGECLCPCICVCVV